MEWRTIKKALTFKVWDVSCVSRWSQVTIPKLLWISIFNGKVYWPNGHGSVIASLKVWNLCLNSNMCLTEMKDEYDLHKIEKKAKEFTCKTCWIVCPLNDFELETNCLVFVTTSKGKLFLIHFAIGTTHRKLLSLLLTLYSAFIKNDDLDHKKVRSLASSDFYFLSFGGQQY